MVNCTVGIRRSSFSGRISSLARLAGGWAHSEGVLFVVSSGNVLEDLGIPGMTSVAFEEATLQERRELVAAAQRAGRHERTLLAPSEALNALTVGAASVDLAPAGWAPRAGEVAIQDDDEPSPAISTAHGPGPFGAIKPDLLAFGGRHDVRTMAAGDNLRLRVMRETGRSGVFVAAARAGPGDLERARGTGYAAAFATRAVLNAAAELTREGGPFAGQELPRRDLALLTRALAVNASRWPEAAHARYRQERRRLGQDRHFQVKEEVARQFGHGVPDADLMREAPGFGATLVGLGTVRKDTAQVFDVPLPPSMSGDSVHRAMYVTLAWFSPMESSRARYRLAALEAVAADGDEFGDGAADRGWHLAMKTGHLDGKMIKRGTLWSRRMVHDRVRVPEFEDCVAADPGPVPRRVGRWTEPGRRHQVRDRRDPGGGGDGSVRRPPGSQRCTACPGPRPGVEPARRAVKESQRRIPGTARTHGASAGVLTLRGMGTDGNGGVGPKMLLTVDESRIDEGDRIRTAFRSREPPRRQDSLGRPRSMPSLMNRA